LNASKTASSFCKCSDVLKNLLNWRSWLLAFPREERSARFELMVAKSLACIFHLPFYTYDTEKKDVTYRATWRGTNEVTPKPACPGPDVIIYAHDFYLLAEMTLSRGAKQWRREFAQSIRHMEEFSKQNSLPRENIYSVLVAPEISHDTFTSARIKQIEGVNIIPLTLQNLAEILEVSSLVHWLRHVDIKMLFDEMSTKIQKTSDVSRFAMQLNSCITTWSNHILMSEKQFFLGLKAYQIFRKVGRNIMTASEILVELKKDFEIKKYSEKIGNTFSGEDVADGLLLLGLACRSGQIGRDAILTPASLVEIQSRIKRILDTFERQEY
jgi:hypothetical protein